MAFKDQFEEKSLTWFDVMTFGAKLPFSHINRK